MATITLTGRTCHRAKIARDEDGEPEVAACECGCGWTDGCSGVPVSEWYAIHVPPPPTPRPIVSARITRG